jgi:hypothetical protein
LPEGFPEAPLDDAGGGSVSVVVSMAARGCVSMAARGCVSMAARGSVSILACGVIARVGPYVPIRQLRSVTLAANGDRSGEGFFGAAGVGRGFLHPLGSQ